MQRSFRTRLAKIGAGAAAVLAPFAAKAQPAALTNLSNNLNATANSAGLTTSQTASLPVLVGRYINIALGLLGVILVVLIVYAGFLWMTAQGNEEKVKKAKGIITNAVIGMILIFAAYAIANFVVSSLVSSLA